MPKVNCRRCEEPCYLSEISPDGYCYKCADYMGEVWEWDEMRRTELIENCTNENDRKLMIEALERSDKRMRKSYLLLGLCILLGFISYSSYLLGFEYGIIGFFPIPFILVYLQVNNLKGVGLL